MKNMHIYILLLLVSAFLMTTQSTNAKGNAKMEVCHIPPDNLANFRTINISNNALKAHLTHGDSVGNCKDVFPDEVELQILAINDFHGNIATSSGSFGGTGRADFLAANIQIVEAEADNSIFVSAGDLIGTSPLISALFHDEPTIEAMNLLGLDINAVGNHEFDEGSDELLRMQFGGSHPVDGDLDGDSFFGADFEFLAANVIVDATGDTLFPAYTIRDFQGIKVAFIGMTLEGTPTIVTPSGVSGLTFGDRYSECLGADTPAK
jgi:2',3'-cyclic-nucleotide 2'-phosphodiesterase (5'-nucleotidase family)